MKHKLLFQDRGQRSPRHSEGSARRVGSAFADEEQTLRSAQSDDEYDDWDYQGKRPDQVQSSIAMASGAIVALIILALFYAITH